MLINETLVWKMDFKFDHQPFTPILRKSKSMLIIAITGVRSGRGGTVSRQPDRHGGLAGRAEEGSDGAAERGATHPPVSGVAPQRARDGARVANPEQSRRYGRTGSSLLHWLHLSI